MSTEAIYSADEFAAEAHYIDTLIWESLMIERGARVLFCGYGPDGQWVKRAIGAGANVTVIEHRNEAINAFASLRAKLLRGSTSVIPAKDDSFDLAVSFHYLHEIDPFFHGQVCSELARVAHRIAVVEPAPPADPLGKRIALLYSQAKRELGQFEYYQPIDYWKKLLQAVKADVAQHVFAFSKMPPHEYLRDTVELLLETIRVEDAPQTYIDELREIAKRPGGQLLPPPRYVLVGAAVGEMIVPAFTPRATVVRRAMPVEPGVAAAAAAEIAQTVQRALAGQDHAITPEAGYEFPPVDAPPQSPVLPSPPSAVAAPPAPAAPAFGFGQPANEAPPAFTPGLPFGAPMPPEPAGGMPPPSPFGAPFAVPDAPALFGLPIGAEPPPAPMGWKWEAPDEEESPFDPPSPFGPL